MRWFEGDIVQAVTQSKARNAVFVVFIEGKDEVSRGIASAIDDASVSSKLEGPNFVSIHLESGTQMFNMFSQIYRDPPVPSVYFIGRSGSPLEIITQVSDSKSLLERVEDIENVHLGKPRASDVPKAPVQSASQSAATSSLLQSERASSAAPAESSESQVADSSSPGTSAAPIEDRVLRAKELLEEKRMKKRIQEDEEARQKELQRRKEGQNVQELRRWQQEEEMKKLREERLKEKRMDEEARQRVLEQIAQDRANRSARNAPSAPQPMSAPSAVSPTIVTSNSNEARIQFRLPDGSTHSNRFDADATLADVRQYIISNITLPFQDFALATVFPRREFTFEENASSLRDLQLIPSSVMLIIPSGGRPIVPNNSPGLFGFAQKLWLFLTYPVTRIFSFVRLLFFAGPPANNSSSSNSGASNSPPGQSQQNAQQDKRPQRRSGDAYRRTGNSNVHRLHQNHSSSDDENNTWNGNSTQQM